MKPFLIRNLLFTTLLFVILASQAQEKGTVYARFLSPCNASQAVEVIAKRLQTFHKKNKAELLKDNRIKLSIRKPIDTTTLQELLLIKGEVAIYETCENFEVYPLMLRINDILKKEQDTTAIADEDQKKYPWFTRLQPNMDHEGNFNPGCKVGSAKASDTAQISAILNRQEVKEFSGHILFMWTFMPVNKWEPVFELVAIKKMTPFPMAFPFSVDKISKEVNAYGFPEIAIRFKKEFHQPWAVMTQNNIGKCLAIVYNRKVLVSPTVHSEITGGAASISGNFRIEDMAVWLAVIAGGNLECNAVLEK